MTTLIRKTVVVQEGGRIELQSDALPNGREVGVTVAVPDTARSGRKLTDMIGSGSGRSKTAEEVDANIRKLRD